MDCRSVAENIITNIGPYVVQQTEPKNFLKLAAIKSIEGGCVLVGAIY